jgi:hypothetical protein
VRHDCTYPEVLVEEADEDENIRAGMRVLVPCPECGDTPLDHMGMLEMYLREAQEAIVKAAPRQMLFHWSPASRRKQILRYGLRPWMRPATSSAAACCVCLADSPSWAWVLSGGMRWTPAGEWDLWQTSLDLLVDPVVLPGPDRPSGIYEVRTEHRLPKRHLWYVGSRSKA